MRKTEIVILIFFILTSLALGYIIFKPKTQTPDYSKKIDSLESELSSIKNVRDSIAVKIGATEIKIYQNEKNYKEAVSNIINNTTNDDYIFFINYLRWNQERFDSINNPDSAKEN